MWAIRQVRAKGHSFLRGGAVLSRNEPHWAARGLNGPQEAAATALGEVLSTDRWRVKKVMALNVQLRLDSKDLFLITL